MMKSHFEPGQIVKLDRPCLGERGSWRFIVLSDRNTDGHYALYCFAAPSYRLQDLNTILHMSAYSLRIAEVT